LKAVARELAYDAFMNHKEAVEIAESCLQKALTDTLDASSFLKIVVRPVPLSKGHGNIISLCQEDPDVGFIHHQEILVATQPDKLECTDNAIGTVVGYTTKMCTLIPNPEGGVVFSQFWEKGTNKAVGIEAAKTVH
jgi:hypothetical protein